jgi:hypothetical protein
VSRAGVDPRELARARALVGKRVTAGAPGSAEYDVGTVKRADETGRVLVAWERAAESYWEHPESFEVVEPA